MINIQYDNADYFELNGRKYSNVYQAVGMGTTHVAIYGVHDIKNQLISTTHYSEFTINGLSYDSQDSLLSALIPILYIREGNRPIPEVFNWQPLIDAKEDKFNKNTAFNKDFGEAAGTVTQGNDIRLAKGVTAFNYIQNSEDRFKQTDEFIDTLKEGIDQEIADINDELDNFIDEVDSVFKDNLLSEAELLNLTNQLLLLSTEKNDLDRRVEDIKDHVNLQDNSNLINAHTVYSTSYTSLELAINALEVTDGEIPIDQRNAVTTALSTYRDALAILSINLDNAINSIAEAKALGYFYDSVDHTDKSIENIEIGGTNLLLNSKEFIISGAKAEGNYFSIRQEGTLVATTQNLIWEGPSLLFSADPTVDLLKYATLIIEEPSLLFKADFQQPHEINKNITSDTLEGKHTFSLEVKGEGTFNLEVLDQSKEIELTSDWQRVYITVDAPEGTKRITYNLIGQVDYKLPQIEKGSKATDYKEAPQDIWNRSEKYVKAEAELARTIAEAHADNIVTNLEQVLITAQENNLEAAKRYAEAEALAAELEAKAHADGEISAMELTLMQHAQANLVLAEEHANAVAAAGELAAKAHADGEITALEQRSLQDATTKADAAKAHAEAQDTLLDTLLKAYTDGKVSALEATLIQEAETNLQTAKAYSDALAAAEKLRVDALVDGEITAVEQRAINEAVALANAAKLHAEAQDLLLKGTLEAYSDGKVDNLESELLLILQQNVQAAETYANAQAEAAKNAAAVYTDGKVDSMEAVLLTENENNLLAAKQYAEAQAAATKLAVESYADGKITEAEQRNLQDATEKADAAKAHAEAQDTLLKTIVEAYADGIVDAEEKRAIQDAKDRRDEAQAYAESLVEGIEIGGRNILLNSKKYQFSGATYKNGYYTVEGDTSFTAHTNTLEWPTPSLLFTADFYLSELNPKNIALDYLEGNIIFSIEVKGEGTLTLEATAGEVSANKTYALSNKWRRVYILINAFEGNQSITYNLLSNGLAYRLPKIETGTKHTGYTEAEEDILVTSEKYTNAKAELERIKAEAYSDGKLTAMELTLISVGEDNLEAAKNYALAQAQAEATEAKAHADGIVTDAEGRMMQDATEKADAAFNLAKAQDALLETLVNAYTDGKVSAMEATLIQANEDNLTTAKQYAEAQAQASEVAAKAHADGEITLSEARAIAEADLKAEAAKTHAEAQDALLKTIVEAYTDGKVSAEEARAIQDAKDKRDEAKAHAESLVDAVNIELGAIKDDLEDVVDSFGGLSNILDGSFVEGIIEASDVRIIKESTAALQTEINGLEGRFNVIYNDQDLPSSNATSLFSDWSDLDNASTDLVDYINNSLRDFDITQQEINTLNSLRQTYRTTLKDFTESVEQAISAIELVRMERARTLAVADTQEQRNQFANDIGDVKGRLVGFEEISVQAWIDGKFSDDEIELISTWQDDITKESSQLGERYINVYTNSYLEGTAKTNLFDAREDYNNSFNALNTSINAAMADGKADEAELIDFKEKLQSYKEALLDFQVYYDNALHSIEQAMVDDIQVGGRNLLLNSYNYRFAGATKKDNHFSVEGDTSFILHTSSDEIWPTPSLLFTADFLIPETTNPRNVSINHFKGRFIFSIEVKGTGNLDITFNGQTRTFTLSNEWERIAFPVDVDTDRLEFNLSTNGLDYRLPQFERGTKVTDYSAAPEDTRQAQREAERDATSVAEAIALRERLEIEANIDGVITPIEQNILDLSEDAIEAANRVQAAENELIQITKAGGTIDTKAQAEALAKYNEAVNHADGIKADLEAAIGNLESEIATLEANAQQMQTTLDELEGRDYTLTEITENVITTGTLEVGSAAGPNAGMTGVTNRARESTRFYAGNGFTNRDAAAWVIRDDGAELYHDENGQLREFAKWGVREYYDANGVLRKIDDLGNSSYFDNEGRLRKKEGLSPTGEPMDLYYSPEGLLVRENGWLNGIPVDNIYDEDGVKVASLGKNGLTYHNWIDASWSTQDWKFQSIIPIPANLQNHVETTMMAQGGGEPGTIGPGGAWQQWRVTFEANTSRTTHVYSAGVNPTSDLTQQFEGFHLKSKTLSIAASNLADDGWYSPNIPPSFWVYVGWDELNNRFHSGDFTLTIPFQHISEGIESAPSSRTLTGRVLLGGNIQWD